MTQIEESLEIEGFKHLVANLKRRPFASLKYFRKCTGFDRTFETSPLFERCNDNAECIVCHSVLPTKVSICFRHASIIP